MVNTNVIKYNIKMDYGRLNEGDGLWFVNTTKME